MPILKFKAIETEKICDISKDLVDELELIVKCPRSYFTLEVMQSVYISDGAFVAGSPVVEVAWFDRGQEVRDKFAECVTKFVNSAGYNDVDVIFINLEKNYYYENGKHF